MPVCTPQIDFAITRTGLPSGTMSAKIIGGSLCSRNVSDEKARRP